MPTFPARFVVPDRELAQPADIKSATMTVGTEHDLDPVARPPRRSHRDFPGQIGDAHQPLAVSGIPAVRAPAVDAQPDPGQPERRTTRPGRRRLGIDRIPRTLRRLLGLACHLTPPPPRADPTRAAPCA